MPLEKAQRYIYDKMPLEQVILQLLFPLILKSDTEIPALFQELFINWYDEDESLKYILYK